MKFLTDSLHIEIYTASRGFPATARLLLRSGYVLTCLTHGTLGIQQTRCYFESCIFLYDTKNEFRLILFRCTNTAKYSLHLFDDCTLAGLASACNTTDRNSNISSDLTYTCLYKAAAGLARLSRNNKDM